MFALRACITNMPPHSAQHNNTHNTWRHEVVEFKCQNDNGGKCASGGFCSVDAKASLPSSLVASSDLHHMNNKPCLYLSVCVVVVVMRQLDCKAGSLNSSPPIITRLLPPPIAHASSSFLLYPTHPLHHTGPTPPLPTKRRSSRSSSARG